METPSTPSRPRVPPFIAASLQVLQSENFGKTWDSEAVSTSQVDYVMNLIQPMLKKTIFNFHGDVSYTPLAFIGTWTA